MDEFGLPARAALSLRARGVFSFIVYTTSAKGLLPISPQFLHLLHLLLTGHPDLLQVALLKPPEVQIREKQICLDGEEDVSGERVLEGGHQRAVLLEVGAVLVVEAQQVVEAVVLAAELLVEHMLL